MPKQLEKLSLYISASAAIVVLVACIVIGAQLYIAAAWVSITIALFYVIGEWIRFFLATKVFPQAEDEDEDEDEEKYEYEDESGGGEGEVEEEFSEYEESAEEEPDGDQEDEMADESDAEEDVENEPVEDAFLD